MFSNCWWYKWCRPRNVIRWLYFLMCVTLTYDNVQVRTTPVLRTKCKFIYQKKTKKRYPLRLCVTLSLKLVNQLRWIAWTIKGKIDQFIDPDFNLRWRSQRILHLYEHGRPQICMDYSFKEKIRHQLFVKGNKTLWFPGFSIQKLHAKSTAISIVLWHARVHHIKTCL